MDKEQAGKLTYATMMQKLDELYAQKESIEQDIELLEMMLMYKFNKDYDNKKKEQMQRNTQWKS